MIQLHPRPQCVQPAGPALYEIADQPLTVSRTQYYSPSSEVIDRYFKEVGITQDSLKRDVATLRSWLEKQPHLPNNIEDKTLEMFLVHSKNSMERAKNKLDLYYCARASVTDMYHNRDPLDPAMKSIAKVAMYCPCPKPTPEGERVTIARIFDYDLKKFDLPRAIKTGLMLLDCHLTEDQCIRHVFVFDCAGVTLGHVSAFTVTILKTAIKLFLDVLPQRHAAFHVVNVPSYFEVVISLAKGLLSKKLAQRLITHTNMESLHQHIDKSVLPPEYGGTYPASIEQLREMAYQSLVEKRDWFLTQNKIMADLSKIPNQKLNIVDDQLEGSFRQISID